MPPPGPGSAAHAPRVRRPAMVMPPRGSPSTRGNAPRGSSCRGHTVARPAVRQSAAEAAQIGGDHPLDELSEAHLGAPAERILCLARITDQQIDLATMGGLQHLAGRAPMTRDVAVEARRAAQIVWCRGAKKMEK